ncbi:fimbrial biogenesis outer membrane usher protein [Providencia burhodogranariea DSM 19968]|uniref:Fimbrial biogenesis outer membrane usher protein n=2 Tax=Providencia burhodogranariea TaxID=516074 RepID=K8W1G0_9GAMM|nr:outer membrane usher protein [Providencia burhodogranariea]EKT53661.1 fimbrial biogenesis outer membrane usher protein [Providencia burhodogranariea DSM 19968]
MFFKQHRVNIITATLMIVFGSLPSQLHAADVMQFNTELFDLEDKKNIDIKQFSRAGYIMPGVYPLKVQLNNDTLPEQRFSFYAPDEDPEGSLVCISPEQVQQLGLTAGALKEISWWHNGECLNLSSLPGLQARGDLSDTTLHLSIPQAYLEYRTENWDPPSLWDEGISGIIFDYNINARSNRPHDNKNNYNVTANGVAGVNLGAWRMRGDWQGRLQHETGSGKETERDFQWSRLYIYKALTSLSAKLTLGEDYLNTDLFDSFRFTGISLRSDILMLPPNLRGYAPEITGVASTNATVIISQQGRIIYQEQVAAGPFRIQNLSDATSGKLDVKIEEQDGSVQEYQVETASIPYLTRPGSVRYKLAMGRPSDMDHHVQGGTFASGEMSWGVTNGWSLLGGSLNSQDYNAFNIGVGRDLLVFGALSFDITHSIANIDNDNDNDKRLSGSSYRINYSKRFDDYDSQVQFAGYRFSERNFMTVTDFLSAKESGERHGSNKEMYVISLNKNFKDARLSAYLNYSHQTYWDKPESNRYNLMLTKTTDFSNFKNINISLSAYRNEYNDINDNGFYISASMPWGNGANIGYSLQSTRDDTVNRATYYDKFDDRTSYQVSAGSTNKGGTASTYITHYGDNAKLTANASYIHNNYTSFGLGAQGGITMTFNGADIHRISTIGGTRLLIDTDGVANIPVKDRGIPITSNQFGKVVVPDINSYYRSKVKVDLNSLPNNAEVTDSIVQATLTEGAIGYRKFNVLSGEKMMLSIRMSDGSSPPFGSQIINSKGQETGIVTDAGYAYISGIKPDEIMGIKWGGESQCEIHFPDNLNEINQGLFIPCKPLTNTRIETNNNSVKE